ncbi:MAG: tetratricopeptide repeat protein, partial [candidate division Zixibacteria bacterium]|nr:tetratricopeptide repeat protein [candidate division Zixibacteria bacterium]
MAKKQKKRKTGRSRSAVRKAIGLTELNNGLQRALEQFHAGNAGECLRQVDTLAEAAAAQDRDLYLRFCYLGASAAYQTAQYNRAESYVLAGVELAEPTVEFELLLALIFGELREFEKCAATARKVIEYLDLNSDFTGNYSDIRSQLHRLYNSLGLACYNLERFEEATEAYDKAIAINRDVPEYYINLSRARARLGDSEGERQAISEGLIHCGDKTDLQKLADRHLTNEMISLCMIVRNEEEMLPQCLRSVKGLVDEIIIVDTGSEDK